MSIRPNGAIAPQQRLPMPWRTISGRFMCVREMPLSPERVRRLVGLSPHPSP